MIRVTKNEHITLTTFCSYDWLQSLYSCVMLADTYSTRCACSPHGISTLHRELLPRGQEDDDVEWGSHESVFVGGITWAFAVFEKNMSISGRTLDPLSAR